MSQANGNPTISTSAAVAPERRPAAAVLAGTVVAGLVGVRCLLAAAQHGGGHAAAEHASDKPFDFNLLYSHIIPHEMGQPIQFGAVSLPIFNIQIFQVLAVVIAFVLFWHVRRSLERSAQGGRMGWVARVFSGWVLWIRDEMVLPVLGEDEGRRFTPYFVFVFFFIAFMNLLGLVPGGLTATACIYVTGALAITTFAMMIGGGMQAQGALAFWKNLVPHGLPSWLVPLMLVVEVIGLLVKPFALTIRLFANMMAGHLVVLSFLGLIFFFAPMLKAWTYAVAVPSVGLQVFIMIIEGFVALLQAYIFTYLSILFVGMCRHPEH